MRDKLFMLPFTNSRCSTPAGQAGVFFGAGLRFTRVARAFHGQLSKSCGSLRRCRTSEAHALRKSLALN
jgi:hypothetical protein